MGGRRFRFSNESCSRLIVIVRLKSQSEDRPASQLFAARDFILVFGYRREHLVALVNWGVLVKLFCLRKLCRANPSIPPVEAHELDLRKTSFRNELHRLPVSHPSSSWNRKILRLLAIVITVTLRTAETIPITLFLQD